MQMKETKDSFICSFSNCIKLLSVTNNSVGSRSTVGQVGHNSSAQWPAEVNLERFEAAVLNFALIYFFNYFRKFSTSG